MSETVHALRDNSRPSVKYRARQNGEAWQLLELTGPNEGAGWVEVATATGGPEGLLRVVRPERARTAILLQFLLTVRAPVLPTPEQREAVK
jgi:hypothetical protein